jgi:predicted ATP-binding protein involved in virulence
MRVRWLGFQGYRSLRNVALDELDEPPLVVLLGVNGAGKSSVLDATAVLLSAFPALLRGDNRGRMKLTEADVGAGEPFASCWALFRVNFADKHWAMRLVTRGRRQPEESEGPPLPDQIEGKRTDLGQLSDLCAELRRQLQADPGLSLPVLAYYRTNRAVLDIPLRIRKRHTFTQLDAYDGALDRAPSNFRLFFEWFRNREDFENELRRDQPEHEDRELGAVRRAIAALLGDDYADLRVRRNPLRMTIRKRGVELSVAQLSDGEKCLLALTGDLARRLAIANPALADPCQGAGIVLIDEIELHLHPRWQRRVIHDLRRTFPNVQFLVSTQSPQVVGEVPPQSVLILRPTDQGVEVVEVDESLGMDSNSILELLMESTERSEAYKQRVGALFAAIDARQFAEAERALAELRDEIGTQPILVEAETTLRLVRRLAAR